MNLNYIESANLCDQAQAVVRRVYSEMSDKEDFVKLCEHIDAGGNFTELREKIDKCAEKYGQNVYELRNTVFIASLETAKNNYIKNGIEEQFFRTAPDIATKTTECLKVSGVYGSKTVEWFSAFFSGTRYTFGRLQYQRGNFQQESYEKKGVSLKKGDGVWYIHIPSCGKLPPESVEESLLAAHAGLPEKKDGKQVFVCGSWLFFPGYHGTVFPEGSNVYRFAEFFDFIASGETDEFKDVWRVFGVEEITDVDALPTETSLQRRFVEYIKNGGKFGNACGVIVTDDNGLL